MSKVRVQIAPEIEFKMEMPVEGRQYPRYFQLVVVDFDRFAQGRLFAEVAMGRFSCQDHGAWFGQGCSGLPFFKRQMEKIEYSGFGKKTIFFQVTYISGLE